MGFCLERPVPPKVWEARWWFLSHGGFAILLLRTEPVIIMAQLLTHLTAECPTSLWDPRGTNENIKNQIDVTPTFRSVGQREWDPAV